eukprot:TRINITY_DN27810_c0_g1_i3.p1 TRINITY_DN27810_c0_g1~~TRINITY_DN27810_c0_g1_i3.p1  ORF type:complete len:405 (+),score=106.75 TRINITY_DN27810_c0_g1_i3:644-1858(+)
MREPPCGWRESDPVPILQDAYPQVHRFHQFSAGRWKFTLETPLPDYSGHNGQLAMIEVTRPIQPYNLNWEVLYHNGQVGRDGQPPAPAPAAGTSKPEKVKAMPDWRNPLGFACDVRTAIPAREHFGVCASIQALEGGQSAFIAGATVLGMNHLPLLLPTLDPEKWSLRWGFDSKGGAIVAVKLMHLEITLPPETITADVLWKANVLREKIRESLMSPDDSSAKNGKKGGKGAGKRAFAPGHGGHIGVPDLSAEMADFLNDIWDEPWPVVKPKQPPRWGDAAGDDDSEVLQSLRPLAEDFVPITEEARLTKAEVKAKNKEMAQAKADAAKARAKAEAPPELEALKAGDRATLEVKFGKYKGCYGVVLIGSDEKGWKVRHDKDGFEEIVKQRDLRSGQLTLKALHG